MKLGFPKGRDSATFRDKGTEVPSLSRDNGTSSKSCHRMGRAGTACQNPGRDVGLLYHYFFPIISCFRTSFPVLEHPFLFYNVISCFRMSYFCFRVSFSCFLVSLGNWFCPGTSRDRGICPGIFAPALVPGQRDSWTRKYFCPLRNPTWNGT